MRIALTGATGFAGPFIVQKLISQGADVAALARRPEAFAGQRLVAVKGDLSDDAALASLVAGADAVLHVAGAISARSRAGFFAANLDGTRKLYAAAQAAGVKRFVFISSLAAREPGLSSYGASKAAAEQFLLGQQTGPEVLILRPPAIYGPGDKATLPLMKALQARTAVIPGRKDSRFALIHVRDFAAIAAAALTSGRTGLAEIDDGAGGYDWAALAAACRSLTGLPQRVVHIPKPVAFAAAAAIDGLSRLANKPSLTTPGKVNELYHRDWTVRGEGWPREAAIPLAEGLAETLAWYHQHGWLPQTQQETRSAS